ncbi:MAG: DUF1588 domain-containing protein [Nannocystis sp.]|uniref:DUF1588 domain-containing protein n=1 Tax=Nannocystis sp. TaxID=1962667 RepID=UPI0024266EEE|nr:DUF1588 domain-containing protein [Nannocystis sp.]MBK9757087.1 DUF1588 domain-containing protein [Nannocystis sp.]
MSIASRSLALLTCSLLAACAREPGRGRAQRGVDAAEVAAPGAATGPAMGPVVAIQAASLRPIAPAAELELLTPEAHLQRVALALRGARPTPAELALVRADANAIAGIVDAYLAAPEFGALVRDVWNEALLLRVDVNRYVLPAVGPLADRGSDAEYLREVPEEPLRLIEYVAVNDRPFSEIVTADYAIASELAIAVWGATPLAADPGARLPAGWKKVAWDSGQPMAGILSSGALWLRHPSNGTNHHRAQADLVAESLLCSGFLARDVPLFNNIDLSDEEVVKRALTTDPGCVSCHQTLDPIASHFFGFPKIGANNVRKAYERGGECANPERGFCYPLSEYREKQAGLWRKRTGRAPNFFGLPSQDLRTLAAQIAEDPRFSMCAARRFYGYLMQVDPDDLPDASAAALQDAFIAGGLQVKPLIKAIVLSDDFRAVAARPGSAAAGLVGRKTTRPEQLERLIADLTGFTWRATPGGGKNAAKKGGDFGEVSLLGTDRIGYRAMAGGVEGFQVTEPSFSYNPTRMLVLQTLAAEAAAYVVEQDFALARPQRRLLQQIDEADAAAPAVRAQIAALYGRVLGEAVTPESAEVDAAHGLFTRGLAGGSRRAWSLVIAALLQDPQVAYH